MPSDDHHNKGLCEAKERRVVLHPQVRQTAHRLDIPTARGIPLPNVPNLRQSQQFKQPEHAQKFVRLDRTAASGLRPPEWDAGDNVRHQPGGGVLLRDVVPAGNGVP